MPSTKEIKRRIKSVTSTKQIVSAMELVSVVKMQKAVGKNLASREFTNLGNDLLHNVCDEIVLTTHPLFKNRTMEKQLVIVITSDRGLCGSLNSHILKLALSEAENNETDFIAIGRKSRDFLLFRKYSIVSSYESFSDDLEYKNIIPIMHQITDDFLADKYGKIKVIYTHFESSLSQVAHTVQLLPFELELDPEDNQNIIFDPNRQDIVTTMVPRMLETRMWQYILESAASEHSARMVAMKNANDNAEDLIFDLTLSFNQTRQAGITREIAEISAGKMTLEE